MMPLSPEVYATLRGLTSTAASPHSILTTSPWLLGGMYSFLCFRYSIIGTITRLPQWRHEFLNSHVLAEEQFVVTLGATSSAASNRVPKHTWSEGTKTANCVYVVV